MLRQRDDVAIVRHRAARETDLARAAADGEGDDARQPAVRRDEDDERIVFVVIRAVPRQAPARRLEAARQRIGGDERSPLPQQSVVQLTFEGRKRGDRPRRDADRGFGPWPWRTRGRRSHRIASSYALRRGSTARTPDTHASNSTSVTAE